MSTDIRPTAKIAAVGVPAVAVAMILAPAALADPPAPDIPLPPGDVAAAPPTEVPHLSSPENLPPGTADEPQPGTLSPGRAYAKSVWEAIREHDITWKEGLLLLTQRPMNANATPPPGVAAGPQEPVPPEPPPADPPPPLPTP